MTDKQRKNWEKAQDSVEKVGTFIGLVGAAIGFALSLMNKNDDDE